MKIPHPGRAQPARAGGDRSAPAGPAVRRLTGDGAFGNGRPLHTSATRQLREAIVTVGDFAVGTDGEAMNRLQLAITGRLASTVLRVRIARLGGHRPGLACQWQDGHQHHTFEPAVGRRRRGLIGQRARRPGRSSLRATSSPDHGPNQVVSASRNPASVPSPTQATCPSGLTSTADGAVTSPTTGSSQMPA
ncbi:MAG: Inositol-monophosphatase [Chloroflexi bacterium]|nr:Inositol-monophosphatase [Chloroflexota bacterium]